MATMNVRTTFALDEETSRTIKELAVAWGVSQAEAVRRAVRLVKEREQTLAPKTPLAVLKELRAQPIRSRTETIALVRQLRTERRAEDAAREDKLSRKKAR
ncbi:MAG: ribbon-helix-helix protein, CopG family [Burkholderiales bacterium]|nr:ribbon-helix-helix protein, CopG family [Burkholderiales bacterium]